MKEQLALQRPEFALPIAGGTRKGNPCGLLSVEPPGERKASFLHSAPALAHGAIWANIRAASCREYLISLFQAASAGGAAIWRSKRLPSSPEENIRLLMIALERARR